MKLDIEMLVGNLQAMPENQLNNILDKRDSDPFDSAWNELYNLVSGNEKSPGFEEMFITISKATNQHEITSYIADDIDLIYRAEKKNINTEFLNHLINTYSKGKVPHEW